MVRGYDGSAPSHCARSAPKSVYRGRVVQAAVVRREAEVAVMLATDYSTAAYGSRRRTRARSRTALDPLRTLGLPAANGSSCPIRDIRRNSDPPKKSGFGSTATIDAGRRTRGLSQLLIGPAAPGVDKDEVYRFRADSPAAPGTWVGVGVVRVGVGAEVLVRYRTKSVKGLPQIRNAS
jgi:hypothetical protein